MGLQVEGIPLGVYVAVLVFRLCCSRECLQKGSTMDDQKLLALCVLTALEVFSHSPFCI